TKEGLERLQKEYQTLQQIKLAKLQREAPPILHSEDLDSEYLIFREDMSLLEARLLELEKILKNYELITPPPPKERNKIFPGASVTLKDEKGNLAKFCLVGSLEANPKEGKISVNSPLGKTLLGKKVGDKIVFSPQNRKSACWKIVKIQYHLI
ncbi:GreA/GreB family elongation factor, partial [Candidatus Parcubacteria bacterium]|nr:GreA/GreB family elongation factor [Candidatus Parcubacteria bacterium]